MKLENRNYQELTRKKVRKYKTDEILAVFLEEKT